MVIKFIATIIGALILGAGIHYLVQQNRASSRYLHDSQEVVRMIRNSKQMQHATVS